MKTAIVLAAASATAVVGQAAFPENFPQCGKTCVTNMINKAGTEQFKDCAAGDAQCLCKNENFAYGVRDCAAQSCPSDQVTAVTSYGLTYCANAGIAISGIPGTASIDPNVTPSITIAATASPTNVVSASGSTFPVSTAEFVTTFVSDGSTIVSTGTATILGIPTVVSGTLSASVSESISGVPVVTGTTITTTGADGAETLITTQTTVLSTSTGSVTTSVLNIESSPAVPSVTDSTLVTTTSTENTVATDATVSPTTDSTASPGGAAQQTAAPVAFFAAAGLAALLL